MSSRNRTKKKIAHTHLFMSSRIGTSPFNSPLAPPPLPPPLIGDGERARLLSRLPCPPPQPPALPSSSLSTLRFERRRGAAARRAPSMKSSELPESPSSSPPPRPRSVAWLPSLLVLRYALSVGPLWEYSGSCIAFTRQPYLSSERGRAPRPGLPLSARRAADVAERDPSLHTRHDQRDYIAA